MSDVANSNAGAGAGAGTGGGAAAPPPAALPSTPPAVNPPAAPAAPAQPAQPASAAAPAAGQEPAQPRVFDAEYVTSIRSEAAENRVAARDAAQRAEQEKARADAAEATAKGIVKERAIETTCRELGLDVTLATRMLASETLEYDETGAPKDLKAKLEALVKDFPFLKGQGDTTAANPNRSGLSLDEQIEQKYGKTTTGIRIA